MAIYRVRVLKGQGKFPKSLTPTILHTMNIIRLRVPYHSLAHLMMRNLVDCWMEALKARPMVTYFAREMLRHLVRLIEAPIAR
jgi:hypothetical protein